MYVYGASQVGCEFLKLTEYLYDMHSVHRFPISIAMPTDSFN